MDRAIHVVTTLVPMIGSGAVSYVRSFFDYETDEDCHRTVPEIIESRGFKCETYTVTTNDGFVLTLHRIVNPLAKRMNMQTPPVLLAHGLFSQASNWLITSDDGHLEPIVDNKGNKDPRKNSSPKNKKVTNNLAFLLANSAYDVWLMNWRGSKYSMRHRRYSTRDARFWDFSLDDWITHDLPCTVNFILEKTANQNLAFIGCGQGAAAALGLLAQEPEFNSKFKPCILLAPTIRMSNLANLKMPVVNINIPVPSLIKKPFLSFIGSFLMKSTPGPALTLTGAEKAVKYLAAGNPFHDRISRLMCKIYNLFSPVDADPSRLAVYASHASLTTSKKNLAQISQMAAHREFCKVDYGLVKNQDVYGDVDPPEYELKNVTNQTIAVIHCKNDSYTSQSDVDYIINQLKGMLLIIVFFYSFTFTCLPSLTF